LSHQSLRVIKREIRVLGIDDGTFVPHVKGKVLVVGAVFRGGYWLEGIMHTKIDVDGLDSTDKLSSMITNSSHYQQLRVIILNGITLGGFNVVDIEKLNLFTKLPVITVTRERPDLKEIYKALKNLPESKQRWEIILRAGEPAEVITRNQEAKIYVQTAGISIDDTKKILRSTSTRSNIPEALRVAHLIASGISGKGP
jgi:endonuclease V-like protein UPF0215 family